MEYHNLQKMEFKEEDLRTPQATRKRKEIAGIDQEALLSKREKLAQLLQNLDEHIQESSNGETEEYQYPNDLLVEDQAPVLTVNNQSEEVDEEEDDARLIQLLKEDLMNKKNSVLKSLNALIMNNSLNLFTTSVLLREAVQNEIEIGDVIEEFGKLHYSKNIMFYTTPDEQKELYNTSLYNYASAIQNAINRNRSIANDSKMSKIKVGVELDLGEVKPNVIFITKQFIIPPIHPFKETIIDLSKLPKHQKSVSNHVYLGKLLKHLLETATDAPEDLKKMTHSVTEGTLSKLPEKVVQVLYEFCQTFFGLSLAMVTNPFCSYDVFKNDAHFVRLGNNFEERKHALLEARRVAKNFNDVFNVKLAEKMSEIRRQTFVIENNGEIKWQSRKHRQ